MSTTPEPRFSVGDRVGFSLGQNREGKVFDHTGEVIRVIKFYPANTIGVLYEIRVDGDTPLTFARYENDLRAAEDG